MCLKISFFLCLTVEFYHLLLKCAWVLSILLVFPVKRLKVKSRSRGKVFRHHCIGVSPQVSIKLARLRCLQEYFIIIAARLPQLELCCDLLVAFLLHETGCNWLFCYNYCVRVVWNSSVAQKVKKNILLLKNRLLNTIWVVHAWRPHTFRFPSELSVRIQWKSDEWIGTKIAYTCDRFFMMLVWSRRSPW